MPDLFCDWPPDYREQFWQAYPRRVDKGRAMKALDKTCESHIVQWQILIEAVRRYAEVKANKDPEFIKHPATWLHAECWHDEHRKGPRTFADIAMGR